MLYFLPRDFEEAGSEILDFAEFSNHFKHLKELY